jgi:hypothetical protein
MIRNIMCTADAFMKLNTLGNSLNCGMFHNRLKQRPMGHFLARADAFMKLNTLGQSFNCGMFHSKLKATNHGLLSRTR